MSTTATVPSAGTETQLPPAAPPPSEPKDKSTDAILDRLDAERTAAEAPPAEEPPAETPAETPSEETPPAEETEPNLEERPQLPENAFHRYAQLKVVGEDGKPVPLFKVAPELRGIIGRHEVLSELGTLGELRALRTKFPTSEDVESITQDADTFRRWGGEFLDDPRQFATTLLQSDEKAFQALAEALPGIVYEQFPQLYRQQAGAQITRSIQAWYGEALRTNDTELAELLAQLGARLNLPLGQPAPAREPDERDREISRLRKERDERAAKDKNAAFQTFSEELNKGFSDGLLKAIDERLTKDFAQMKDTVRQRIGREIWDEVQQAMSGQPQTQAHVRKAIEAVKAGKAGKEQVQPLLDFLLARAKQTLPPIYSRITTEWTRDIVAANRSAREKASQTADRTKEAGSARGGAAPAAAPSGQRPARRSQEQIMDELAKGTYQPRK